MMKRMTSTHFIVGIALSSILMVSAIHNKCVDLQNDPDTNIDSLDHNALAKREASYCTACYMETLAGLKKESGTDLVFGANDGISFDPAWFFGYWQNVPNHQVTWVEPIPELYRRLSKNTYNITNKLLLNLAVKPKLEAVGPEAMQDVDRMRFYCWDIDMVDKYMLDGTNPLPDEMAHPKEYWKTLCTTDRETLTTASNVFTTKFYAATKERQIEMTEMLQPFIVSYDVPALTPAEIMWKHNMTNILYLQVDLEGLDNEVIRSLPFDYVKPKMILFENHKGNEVKPLLEAAGYHVCCCLQQWGSNIVAVLKDDAARPNLAPSNR